MILPGPLALSMVLAAAAPAPRECVTVKLTPPLAQDQEVLGYSVVPDDSDRVAYLSDIVEDGVFQLYTVPTSGATPGVLFDVGLPDGRRVFGFPALSPNGLGVFRANFDTEQNIDLYSVTTADGGGIPLKLNGPLNNSGDVQPELFITPDGANVVYLAEELSDREELYVVPITGGQSRRLNTDLVSGDVEEDFQLTPDGASVVYRAAKEDFRDQLYVVSLAGGDPIKLNGPLGDTSEVLSFQISADSSTVVYEADQETNNLNELFRVPIGGGPTVKINGPEIERNVDDYGISPDGAQVVYLAPSFDGPTFRFELYSAPLAGGNPLRISADLPVDGFINRFTITPDSQRVVYIGSQETRGLSEIYSVPLTGGTPIKLSGDLSGTDGARGFWIAPDNQSIVFSADLNPDSPQALSLQVSSITGGGPLTLDGPFVENGNVDEVTITADSSRVIYSGDLVTQGQTEIFSANLSATGAVQRLSGSLPADGSVGRFGNDDFQISANGQRIVYLADRESLGVKELYSSELNCEGLFRDGFE